jgi:hypothetical protein
MEDLVPVSQELEPRAGASPGKPSRFPRNNQFNGTGRHSAKTLISGLDSKPQRCAEDSCKGWKVNPFAPRQERLILNISGFFGGRDRTIARRLDRKLLPASRDDAG